MLRDDIKYFGKYRLGLTTQEIKGYLKNRANEKGIKFTGIWKKFCKIAGVNTMAIEITDCCKKEFSLMYRHDVERFADVLFEGKPTYWRIDEQA